MAVLNGVYSASRVTAGRLRFVSGNGSAGEDIALSRHLVVMSPTNLQGLNIVLPTSPAGDARDLVGHPYPDLAAQLDLWTNLAFDSDEGPAVTKVDEEALARKSVDDDDDHTSSEIGSPDNSHVNVVSGNVLGMYRESDLPRQQSSLDINSLLAGLGIELFSAPQESTAFFPSLAQLLALHAVQSSSPSAAAPASGQPQKTRSAEKNSHAGGADEASPPAKRPRNRRTSEMLAAASADGALTSDQVASVAAEDKRRRNTAASARFRLKKKEREAALEGKAKELEVRVSELERECETLRRENGWLKGLVIGVTGATQAPVVGAPQFGTASKRSREEAAD